MDLRQYSRSLLSGGFLVLVFAAVAGGALAYLASSHLNVDLRCAASMGVICLIAATVSLLPFALMDREQLVPSTFASMSIRVALSVAGAVVVSWVGYFEAPSVAGWFVYWYSVFLFVEVTWVKSRLLQSLPASAAGGGTAC